MDLVLFVADDRIRVLLDMAFRSVGAFQSDFLHDRN